MSSTDRAKFRVLSPLYATSQPHQLVRHDDDLRHPPTEILLALAHHGDLLFGDAIFVKPLEQLVLPVISRGAGANYE